MPFTDISGGRKNIGASHAAACPSTSVSLHLVNTVLTHKEHLDVFKYQDFNEQPRFTETEKIIKSRPKPLQNLGYAGASRPHENALPPWDHHRAMGIGLLRILEGGSFL